MLHRCTLASETEAITATMEEESKMVSVESTCVRRPKAFRTHLRTALENVEKQSKRTKGMLLSAMENVERKSRQTKEKLTLELRSAIEEVERKRIQTKTILKKAKTEFLYAMEEKEQNRRKNYDLKGGRVIPHDAVHKFRQVYEYNATCGSVLELMFFQWFWIRLSQKVPNWIMPCTITFSGLLVNIACCLILLSHSPDALSEVPAWTMILCSVSMFLYQTLDALDGKQAAKLQNTHLEEFADHGSDSLSTSFVTLGIAVVLQLGTDPDWMLLLFFASLIGFYSTHWQTYVTNIVVFGRIDVTEAQCSMMLLHIFASVYGFGILHQKVIYDFEIRHLMVLVTVISLALAIFGNLRIIFGGKTPLDEFTEIPRKKGVTTVYPVVPLAVWLGFAIYIKGSLFIISPCLFCLFFGVMFSKLLVKLQLATLGGIECDLWDSVLFVPLLLSINQHLQLVPAYTALLGGMVFVSMDLLRFVTYLVWDLCEFQDIYVFSLKYPVGHPLNRNGSHGIYVNGLNNKQVMEEVERRRNSSVGQLDEADFLEERDN